MARKRTAPAASSRRGKPTEPGARELGVESGPAPPLGPEPDDVDAQAAGDDDNIVDDDRPPLQAPTPGFVEALEEWEAETVGLVLSALLLGFHWTLGRGGPPDAFVPDDAELSGMARPATRMLNRSERARRLAKHGDGVAFATAFGGFVAKETREVAEYRAAAAGGQPLEPELVDVGGVAAADGEHVQGPVRRWRPPAVEPDAPPS